MNKWCRGGLVLGVAFVAGWIGVAQTTAQTTAQISAQITAQSTPQTVVAPSDQHISVAGQSAPVSPAAEMRTLNERQKALADETDRLLSLATELKAQVDMTSRNILSVKVIRKAEEIELYARRIKSEAKR